MTYETDVSSVAGGMWTTTQQTWRLKAGRSMYVQQQPERHGWRQLTAWRAALPRYLNVTYRRTYGRTDNV